MILRRFLIVFWILCAVSIAVQLALSPAEAAVRPFQLREVSLSFRNYFPGGVNPLITYNGLPDRHLDKDVDVNLSIDLFRYFYWNNLIHSTTDKDSNGSGQFRLIGWQFSLGVDFGRMWDWLPVMFGYAHHSQHLLDYASPYHFPVQDALEIRIFLYSL